MLAYSSIVENRVTSQKYCASDLPNFFTDELLYMTSLVEFRLNPRAQDPTTRHTPSGFLPCLIYESQHPT